ncbi:MAG: glutamate 2,3-aminomutase [Bacilli bacterium]|nr:glutamate 2,3-aminomutase [Bacilli bacterium]MBN2877119.1 glutamate 2,3-aminomutase [Bacilli bacterium]
MKTSREISLERAKVLKTRIDDYLEAKKSIPKGWEQSEVIQKRKQNILTILDATEENWNDWHWQLKHRIRDVDTLLKFIRLSDAEIEEIKAVSKVYRWAISPYYLSLINVKDKMDPIRLLAIPSALELRDHTHGLDPMGEEFTNPAGTITRRYPDRLIINVTNECAMYCRHCQRRRNIGTKDRAVNKTELKKSIDYIRENEEIRDVLITGGDPFTLANQVLEWLLKELKAIPHVEYVRIGTRTPVTMPQRITDKLCTMLKKYHPIYINTHFNHPMEVTYESKMACEKLANAGIPLGNQAVLLNGINNDKFVMQCLNQELLKIRVKPYYIFHAKKVRGTMHFNTSIDDGLEIMEHLRGYTSGMAIPTYIVNAPLGKGKTPMLPQYLLSRGKDHILFRTWEGEMIHYENHPTIDLATQMKELENKS